jgi:radical SAM enzyme (TIGR04100 family)
MPMTITYELENSLYLNITNRCSSHCSFCVRNNIDGMIDGMNLWLEKEPTIDDVIADIQTYDVSKYKEIVFCGYGEPMMRAYDIIEICKRLKTEYRLPIRINTNGQANLICGCDITPQLYGLVDAVSISLNAKNKQLYQELCLSDYGEKSFDGLLDFAIKCKKYIPNVALSVVDIMCESDIRACRAIAQGIGVDFRVRKFVK